jgi:hypothetical protein
MCQRSGYPTLSRGDLLDRIDVRMLAVELHVFPDRPPLIRSKAERTWRIYIPSCSICKPNSAKQLSACQGWQHIYIASLFLGSSSSLGHTVCEEISLILNSNINENYFRRTSVYTGGNVLSVSGNKINKLLDTMLVCGTKVQFSTNISIQHWDL